MSKRGPPLEGPFFLFCAPVADNGYPHAPKGCKTCKRRRIRCDETRPSCLRCQRSKIDCDYGLAAPTASASDTGGGVVRAASPQAQKTVPTRARRTFVHSELCAQPAQKAAEPLPPHQPSLLDLSPEQNIFLDIFRDRVLDSLGLLAINKTSIARVLMQQVLVDEDIRASALSIGALLHVHESRKSSAWASRRRNGSPPSAEPRDNETFATAVKFHVRALSKFRQRVASKDPSLSRRLILIMSVLFVIFENILGDTKSVDRLMAITVQMLQNDLCSMGHPGPRITMPVDEVTDEDITELNVLLFTMGCNNSWCLPSYPNQRAAMCKIGDGTTSIRPPDPSSPPETWYEAYRVYHFRTAIWAYQTCQTLGFSGTATDDMLAQQDAIVKHYCTWLQMIRTRVGAATTPDELLKWTMTLFSTLGAHPLFACLFDTEDTMYDLYTEYFREALDAFERHVSIAEANSHLGLPKFTVWNQREIQTLLFIMIYSRDIEVRTRARVLCATYITVDSTWDEKAMFIAGTEQIKLEEAQRSGSGMIPKEARLRWILVDWNEEHTELTAEYLSLARHDVTSVVVGPESDYPHLF
ncbi:hypothetical protein Micbo1qcDRAFT_219292 [Microdochium bolleyi]|uniref:Zn(2)-C6 fungal-type domain-containing protein n=1 Tax=Microdochium bolleyi TaxID=196109 RepID=A0A136IN34_9PEZI|nr:hypothetical protein Micbo1qcDRAFT_219292 [Microdochium bolleyi]